MALAVSCITVAGNNTDAPPVINYLTSDKTSPQDAGAVITWTANASDPDGDPVLYRFFLNDKPMMDWATDNMWIWSTNDVDAGSNRIEVQVRDGKHAGPSGLDDVRSAGFTLNTHATTVEPGVFKQVSKVHQEPASSPKPVDLITAKVTLTLHVREGSSSGPIIPGAQVIVQDGSGNMFHETFMPGWAPMRHENRL